MRILFLEGFDRTNFSTRWRTYCTGKYLAARGHEVRYYHLLLTAGEVPGLSLLPRLLQQVILRLLSALRAYGARKWCRWADRVIVLNAYSSPWLIRYLQSRCGGYVYDTVDFADVEDFIRLHAGHGFWGAVTRWKMRANHRTFLAFLDGASLVCTNNFFCIEQARARGKATHLFIDPIPNDYLRPCVKDSPHAPFTIGWTGSASTVRYMSEYCHVLGAFTRAGTVRIELMEADAPFANGIGATVVPWTVENFARRLPQWSIGIAPLPSHVPFTGKFPGKILQYMAAGIPSIVTPKGMATHFITDGETGMYAETAEDWQRCIRHLIEHPDECRRMGANARQDFERRFSLEAQIPDYERVVLGISSGQAVEQPRQPGT